MDHATGTERTNWFGDIRTRPHTVVRPRSVEEIRAVVRDPGRYPSPVRAAGSNHSTTRCVVADGGTVVDMRGMDRVLEIGPDTVTAEAGALYIDVARELRKRGKQFHVNIELGNLTMGAAACTHTKDGSFPEEFGIVSSYAVGMKVVTQDGGVLAVGEAQPELRQAMRTSFGLLGIVYEVTFRIKPLQPMEVRHRSFGVDELEAALPELRTTGEALMYYLYPFQEAVTVEFRRYRAEGTPGASGIWRVRNSAWKTVVPALAGSVSRYVPGRRLRGVLLDGLGSVSRLVAGRLHGRATAATDQLIRYPERSGPSRYTFSIWAFPEAEFSRVLREYFALCRRWHREHGYRCDLPNVGYRIAADPSSLLSYTYHGTAMTVDPVSTGGGGWPEFLAAYNEFCSGNGGSPLFNQTAGLTVGHVRKAFGERVERFRGIRERWDPGDRFLNAYFAELLGAAPTAERSATAIPPAVPAPAP